LPPVSFELLVVTSNGGGVLARPTLSIFLYSDKPVRELGPAAASAIESYIAAVGENTLKTYVGNNGDFRKLSHRKLTKDLDQLRHWPERLSTSWIEYDSDPNGWAGEFGVFFYATDFSTYEWEKEGCNLLRFDWPVPTLDRMGLDAFLEFVLKLAQAVPLQSGNVGYCFKRTTSSKQEATRPINRMIPRFMGFDPCYQEVRESMRGRTFTVHWINLLGASLARVLGGHDAIAKRLSGADVRLLGDVTFIRSVKRPPIGDANRKAPDIGLIPEVARVLRPTRVNLAGFGEPGFEPGPWLARFDSLEVRPWDPPL